MVTDSSPKLPYGKAGLSLWQVLHSLTFFLRQIEINELQPPETQTIHGLLLLFGLWAQLLFPGEDHVLRTLSWWNESLPAVSACFLCLCSVSSEPSHTQWSQHKATVSPAHQKPSGSLVAMRRFSFLLCTMLTGSLWQVKGATFPFSWDFP